MNSSLIGWIMSLTLRRSTLARAWSARVDRSAATTRARLMLLIVLLRRVIRRRLVVEELRDVVSENELEVADRAVALLSDDDLGDTLLLRVLVVHLIAVDEADDVRVLFDRSRLAEIGELRPVIAGALLGTAGELRERNEREVQLLGDRFQAARDLRDFLVARLGLPLDGHELEVVDHDHVQAGLHLQAPRFGSHLH